MLIKEAFGEIDYEEESKRYEAEHTKEEEFCGQVVRLFKELIMIENIYKVIVSSLFAVKSLELNNKPVSPYVFETGGFQDLPEFLEAYKLRELKKIRELKNKITGLLDSETEVY